MNDIQLTSMRESVASLLTASEVFPKHIRDMLQSELANLDEDQLSLLEKILREEKSRLAELQ